MLLRINIKKIFPSSVLFRIIRKKTSEKLRKANDINFMGLPDTDTLREIEHRSGRTSVMVRSFNVNMNQVNGSGDSLAEQSRPLLQVEDIRRATGGGKGLLDSRDHGFFTVDMPEFWERPEMSGYLRDVREKPGKYAWLGSTPRARLALPAPASAPTSTSAPRPAPFPGHDDCAILDILAELETGREM